MTQQELADAAMVSLNTIQRGEASDTSPWRRSTAIDIYGVLNHRIRLSAEESDTYLEATGVSAQLAATTNKAAVPDASIKARPEEVITSHDENTAHTWLAALVRERGVGTVLSWLEALAATNGVPLPPRLPANSPMKGPRWATYREVLYPDGWVVTERGPVQSPAAPAQGKPGEQPKRAQRM